jgi:hypothetical protein
MEMEIINHLIAILGGLAICAEGAGCRDQRETGCDIQRINEPAGTGFRQEMTKYKG